MSFLKQFGGSLSPTLKQNYSQSKNWQNGKFLNLQETKMDISLRTIPGLLKKQFINRKERSPEKNIPIQRIALQDFLVGSDSAKIIWYGHSALLLRIQGKTIFIDPMLGSNAAPIAPFAVKRFSANSLQILHDLPEIDLMLISHDHYDHLDYESIQILRSKTRQYYVALGVARHLQSWGIDSHKIEEFDWWKHRFFEDINITFTPTRHFSGRGFTDRATSLWGGWAIHGQKENLYFSGDSGYGVHFKEVGKRLGPFGLGFMECGQYNKHWHQIHMYPEETVQAALDAGVQKSLPVHWGAFALSLHSWKNPIERFVAEALKLNHSFISPQIGELIHSNQAPENSYWWQLIN